MSITVAELSESTLLERIFPRLLSSDAAIVGPGDDAAVLAAPDGQVVISIDTLVENQDFRLSRMNGHITSGFDVGWKAAAQNLSDMNAMGARATSLVVSLTLPDRTPIEWVDGFADGLAAAIVQLGAGGCGVIGGDLGGGRELAVSIAVTGTLDSRTPVLRSGANGGDIVAIAGTVGRAAAGLALMESNHEASSLEPDMLDLVLLQRRPRPPLGAGPAASAAGARAMLDLSDGLVRDAGRIAKASGVHISLNARSIELLAVPLLTAAALLKVDPLDWVLSGGEDYGLLATFPSGTNLPEDFLEIGRVTEGRQGVDVGSRYRISGGWDHFSG
ncbi:thiamine-phosphate kinase [Arthrobacter sp. TMT4-20]